MSKRKDHFEDLEDMLKEGKKADESKDESLLEKTLELTKELKFNFEENRKENVKKNGISILNVVGEVNLLCIGYYIYLLVFTNYQDNKNNYLITGYIIIFLVLLFGLSVITRKKTSKVFSILNIFAIIVFIIFNTYVLMN